MKKIFLIIMACLIYGIPSYGANVCAKTNTYIGVLRKDLNGTYLDSGNLPMIDNTIKAWRTDFDYDNDSIKEKTITGLASCNGITNTFGTAVTNLYTDATDSGTNCWCKMEPVRVAGAYSDKRLTGITSYWTYLTAFSTESDCASDCTTACAHAVADSTWAVSGNNIGFRSKLFEAIW